MKEQDCFRGLLLEDSTPDLPAALIFLELNIKFEVIQLNSISYDSTCRGLNRREFNSKCFVIHFLYSP